MSQDSLFGDFGPYNTTLMNVVGSTTIDYTRAPTIDDVFRVVRNSTMTRVTRWKTSDFRDFIGANIGLLEKDIGVLKSVVNWQRHKLDYQALYTAYLLGAIPEQEFMQEAEHFATETTELPVPMVSGQLADLHRLLGDEALSPSDLAEFLGVSIEQVLEASPRFSADPDRAAIQMTMGRVE